MIKIFATALNLQDHNTYDGVWHNQRERFTRLLREKSEKKS